MKKQTIFKIIAIFLPLVLILIVEFTLRIIGYGNDYQLFRRVSIENKTGYLEMNVNIAGKYFKDNGLSSDNQSDLFLNSKTDNTFRIFVQGASTVVGFPYYRGGSFPRMLKHRLALTFPEKNIEVINTGITAVNSYTLWDLTDDIIAQKPDLVIIYAGHNEYYGALGVGSTISNRWSNPTLIRTYLNLKKSYLFQLLEKGYYNLISTTNKKPIISETTLMEVLAKEQRISYNSKVYQNGLTQFESNLDKILSKYNKYHIPVIISTVVCNEKDIKPFISDSIPNENQFLQDLEQGKPEANTLAQSNAMAAYLFGRHYLDINQDSAKKYLHLAKELDFLRFRAPDKINELIVNLSEKHNITFVDMEDIFLKHSTQNVIGDELMTEHVHPNVKGQFLMADAFYLKIQELNLLSNWSNYIPFDEAYQNIPLTEIDSIHGTLVIDDLKQSWPFDLTMSGALPISSYIESPSYEQQRALDIYRKLVPWDQVMAQSYEKYEREKAYSKALRVAESLIFEYPEQGEVYRMAGVMCLNLDKLNKATYYFSKFNQLEKNSLSAELLASVYIKLNETEMAKNILLEAKNRGLNVKEFDKMIQDEHHLMIEVE